MVDVDAIEDVIAACKRVGLAVKMNEKMPSLIFERWFLDPDSDKREGSARFIVTVLAKLPAPVLIERGPKQEFRVSCGAGTGRTSPYSLTLTAACIEAVKAWSKEV